VDASCHCADACCRINASLSSPARGRFLILLMPANERPTLAKVPASLEKIKLGLWPAGNIVPAAGFPNLWETGLDRFCAHQRPSNLARWNFIVGANARSTTAHTPIGTNAAAGTPVTSHTVPLTIGVTTAEP
jgi:hypothetical protein